MRVLEGTCVAFSFYGPQAAKVPFSKKPRNSLGPALLEALWITPISFYPT